MCYFLDFSFKIQLYDYLIKNSISSKEKKSTWQNLKKKKKPKEIIPTKHIKLEYS